jgi:hypothetical protein
MKSLCPVSDLECSLVMTDAPAVDLVSTAAKTDPCLLTHPLLPCAIIPHNKVVVDLNAKMVRGY